MGIDLRTGAVGKSVYAAEAGYISRIRCSPYGYGKALYLTLNDGNTVVYAHLNDFAPPFQDYVRRAQHDRKKYEVDLYPDPGMFPVKRGRLIAKSGQTGIGVPHLHYEWRDPRGVPVSPRHLGITWPDTTPPKVRKALVLPLEPYTTVNGDVLPVILGVTKVGPGRFTTKPVAVNGPIAFGIDVIDPANGGGTRLGIYRVVTTAGGKEIFRMEHERVSYANDQDGVVAYDPYLLDRGRFLLQWRWPGNDSEIFHHGPADGRFELREETAAVNLAIEDFYENSVTLTIPLILDDAQTASPVTANPSARGDVDFDVFAHGLVVSASFTDDEPLAPEFHVDAAQPQRVAMRRIDNRTFRTVYRPDEASLETTLSVEHPRVDAPPERYVFVTRNAPSSLHRFDHLLLRARPITPYGILAIHVDAVTPAESEELVPAGYAYRIAPENAPLEAPITLSFPPPDSGQPAPAHVYRQGKREWEFLDTRTVNGRLEADADRFGVYAVMRDTTPPRLRIQRPNAGETLVSARPQLRAAVRDEGSGIGEFSATYNGAWILMEYDPERHLLTWEQDEDLPAGPGEWVVEVSDQAGNVTRQAVRVNLPADVR